MRVKEAYVAIGCLQTSCMIALNVQFRIALERTPSAGCRECGKPIAGVAPTLSAHLEFREHQEQLTSSFQPLLRAWLSIRKNEEEFGGAYTLEDRQNNRRSAILRNLNCAGVKLPDGFSRSIYNDISVLKWQRLVKLHQKVGLEEMSVETFWKFVKLGNRLYRQFLMRIERWLKQNEQIVVDHYYSILAFQWSNETNRVGFEVSKYHPKVLALCMLRWELEANFGHTPFSESINASIHDSYLRSAAADKTIFLWPKQRWLGFLYTTYASWYHRLLLARRSGKLHINDFQPMKMPWKFDGLASRFSTDWIVYKGCYAFPTIEGLPLPSWALQKNCN